MIINCILQKQIFRGSFWCRTSQRLRSTSPRRPACRRGKSVWNAFCQKMEMGVKVNTRVKTGVFPGVNTLLKAGIHLNKDGLHWFILTVRDVLFHVLFYYNRLNKNKPPKGGQSTMRSRGPERHISAGFSANSDPILGHAQICVKRIQSARLSLRHNHNR